MTAQAFGYVCAALALALAPAPALVVEAGPVIDADEAIVGQWQPPHAAEIGVEVGSFGVAAVIGAERVVVALAAAVIVVAEAVRVQRVSGWELTWTARWKQRPPSVRRVRQIRHPRRQRLWEIY